MWGVLVLAGVWARGCVELGPKHIQQFIHIACQVGEAGDLLVKLEMSLYCGS